MLGPSDLRKVQQLMLPNDDPNFSTYQALFNHRFPKDVSRKSVEETAASVIKIYEISKKNAWYYFSFKKQS